MCPSACDGHDSQFIFIIFWYLLNTIDHFISNQLKYHKKKLILMSTLSKIGILRYFRIQIILPFIWGWLGSAGVCKRYQNLIKMNSNLSFSILIFYRWPRKTYFNTQCPVGGRGSDRRQRWYVNCLTLMSNRQMMATYHQIEIRWMALMADGVTNICQNLSVCPPPAQLLYSMQCDKPAPYNNGAQIFAKLHLIIFTLLIHPR